MMYIITGILTVIAFILLYISHKIPDKEKFENIEKRIDNLEINNGIEKYRNHQQSYLSEHFILEQVCSIINTINITKKTTNEYNLYLPLNIYNELYKKIDNEQLVINVFEKYLSNCIDFRCSINKKDWEIEFIHEEKN